MKFVSEVEGNRGFKGNSEVCFRGRGKHGDSRETVKFVCEVEEIQGKQKFTVS